MRTALVLLLALACPATACPLVMSPAEVFLMLLGPVFAMVIGGTWLVGVLLKMVGRGDTGARALALATLSAGFVEAGTLLAAPLSAVFGPPYNRLIPPATILVLLMAGPYWARCCVRASEARCGRVVPRAGSILFPLAFAAGCMLLNAGVVAGAALCLTPALALFAIPIDRAAEPRPFASPLAPRRGHCPVCRELVRDRVAECARCRTPHHRECLEFNGRCGIFACEPGAPDPTAKKKTAS